MGTVITWHGRCVVRDNINEFGAVFLLSQHKATNRINVLVIYFCFCTRQYVLRIPVPSKWYTDCWNARVQQALAPLRAPIHSMQVGGLPFAIEDTDHKWVAFCYRLEKCKRDRFSIFLNDRTFHGLRLPHNKGGVVLY